MKNPPAHKASSGLNLFIKVCKWLWPMRSFFWTTIALNVILAVFTTLLFTSPSSFKNLPIEFALNHPDFVLLSFIILVLITCIIALGNRLPESLPAISSVDDVLALDKRITTSRETEQYYLRRLIREKEILTLRGIPAGLIAPKISLDNVFIPLKFRANQPPSDYPLTEKELKLYRELLKNNAISEEMEKVLFRAEKDWLHFEKRNRISFEDLWSAMSVKQPAVVIQGYPGMGKSTLLTGIALHMAHYCLDQSNAHTSIFVSINQALIPISLSLANYATEWERAVY